MTCWTKYERRWVDEHGILFAATRLLRLQTMAGLLMRRTALRVTLCLRGAGVFFESSCATRLNASVATVLSGTGVVIPHVQREQHQPLKLSPSMEMRRLFIYTFLVGIVSLPQPTA